MNCCKCFVKVETAFLHDCSGCGHAVCVDCWDYDTDTCIDCADSTVRALSLGAVMDIVTEDAGQQLTNLINMKKDSDVEEESKESTD